MSKNTVRGPCQRPRFPQEPRFRGAVGGTTNWGTVREHKLQERVLWVSSHRDMAHGELEKGTKVLGLERCLCLLWCPARFTTDATWLLGDARAASGTPQRTTLTSYRWHSETKDLRVAEDLAAMLVQFKT